MSETKRLPVGWADATLTEIAQIFMGQSPASSLINSDKKGLPFFQGKTEFTDVYPLVNKYCEEPSRIAEKDDILLSVRAPVGPVNIAKVRSGFGRGLSAIRGYTGIDYKFLFYQLRSIEKHIESLGTGSTFSGINRDKVESLLINIAPQKEQTRIVYKLEELFSELDAGVKELKAAQIKLSQYRQSLLKSAVEGSLTQQWRAENSDLVQETGEQLLARILKQRREQWQQQKLAEFAEKGKTPPKNWQDKYPEPVQPDTSDLPKLPEGWVWVSLSQIGWLDRGKSKHRPRNAEHLFGGVYPFVQTGEIRSADQYVRHTEKTYSDEGLKQSKLWPKGTMCITIAANIGETAILDIDACFPDSIVGFSTIVEDMPIEYVEYVFRVLKHKLGDKAPATAQKNINLEILSKEAIPLPPVIEQVAIVKCLNTALENVKLQKTATALALKQSEAQRKNILKSAFSGQLVPQDPNDEPASVLLEKIKQEREALAKKPKSKQIKIKSAMKKITVEELAKWVGNYKGNSFTFEELQTAFQGDYDQLKGCIFDMLSAQKPLFKQVFDQKLNTIMFIKEEK